MHIERGEGNVRKSIGNNDRAMLQAKIIQVAQVNVITAYLSTKKRPMNFATRIIVKRDNCAIRKMSFV